MEDIILNGVSLKEMQANKNQIAKEATKFVAVHLATVKHHVKELFNSTTGEEVLAHAKVARDELERVKLVANISGIVLDLPTYNTGGGTPYSSRFEDIKYYFEDNDIEVTDDMQIAFEDESITELYEMFEELETESDVWNSSRC